MKIVLQKFIAESGLCSRRAAEELIRVGRVSVNGVLAELGQRVDGGEKILIDGKEVGAPMEKIYIKINKPVGYVCTNRHFPGEKSIFDLIKIKERLHVAGRLDKDSRGLVILTNDGDYTKKVTHPSSKCEKKYLVKIAHDLEMGRRDREEIISQFKKGIEIEGGLARTLSVEYKNGVFKITLNEGKKRQIRRMFEAVGCRVIDLKRISIGEVELGDLKEGGSEKLEVRSEKSPLERGAR